MKNKVRYVGKISKKFLHIFGIGCIVGSLSIFLLIFYYIFVHGLFIAREPYLSVLAFEVFLVTFGIGYALYLFHHYVEAEFK